MPPLGRRPGASGSRGAILRAARRHFAEVGYDRATIRRIATGAGVDPALVLHFYGSKEELFSAAMDFPRPADVLPRVFGPGVEGLGERVTRFFLETWESDAGEGLLGLLRSLHTSERAAVMMREFVSRELLARVAPTLSGRDRELRATLAVSHLIGLAVMRYVVRLEPLASASPAALARRIGPTIQRYFDGP
ncbi:MAG TPA: TetR family transcriptional regulator [Candidatus Limnocylindria bacterium]|nr:TetR family transcriptional regulator [Candidatus Limnocylindria bacterium]